MALNSWKGKATSLNIITQMGTLDITYNIVQNKSPLKKNGAIENKAKVKVINFNINRKYAEKTGLT